MRVTRLWGAAAVAAAALPVTGCGGGVGSAPTTTAAPPVLTVSAATSLKPALTAYGEQFYDASARFSFAGSRALAARIERGVRPDVYAAANTDLPHVLFAKGLVERPTVFARSHLVLAVRTGTRTVRSLADAERPGVALAVGAASGPVGVATRAVLGRLPAAARRAIVANVRVRAPDAAAVAGALAKGAADAGIMDRSDVRAAGGKLRAIELPPALRPTVAYGAAVVKGARHPSQAQAFIDGLVDGAGRQALTAAGLQPATGG